MRLARDWLSIWVLMKIASGEEGSEISALL